MSAFTSPEGAVNFAREFGRHRDAEPIRFELRYLNLTVPTEGFRAECVRRAVELGAQATAPIVVHLSGGIDSEVVARCFLEAGVPFRALSFRYRCGNRHDLQWAEEFCREVGLPHEVRRFEEPEFLAQAAASLMREFSSYDLYPAFEIERVRAGGGFAVLGNGEPQLRCDSSSGEIYLLECRGDTVLWEWQLQSGTPGCLHFFRSCPRLVASFLRDPVVREWCLRAQALGLTELGDWKLQAYQRHWPELRPRPKWTGYEAMAASYLPVEAVLKKEFHPGGDELRLPLKDLGGEFAC